jgi:hypothetical protein
MGRRKLVKVCPIIQNTEINVVLSITRREVEDKELNNKTGDQ